MAVPRRNSACGDHRSHGEKPFVAFRKFIPLVVLLLLALIGAETLADGRFHYGDCAMLGCFSSAERVAAAIEKYRSIPGFCDYPNGFVVFAHEVEEHAVLVYLANVYIHDAEYEFEYSRNLGVFKNEGDARLAVEVFRQDNSTWWGVLTNTRWMK